MTRQELIKQLGKLEQQRESLRFRGEAALVTAVESAQQWANLDRQYQEAEQEQDEIIRQLQGVVPEVEAPVRRQPRRFASTEDVDAWREQVVKIVKERGIIHTREVAAMTGVTPSVCGGRLYSMRYSAKWMGILDINFGKISLVKKPAPDSTVWTPPAPVVEPELAEFQSQPAAEPAEPLPEPKLRVVSAFDSILALVQPGMEAGDPIDSTALRKKLSLRMWNYIRGFLTHFPDPPLLTHDKQGKLVYNFKPPAVLTVQHAFSVLREQTDYDAVLAAKKRAQTYGVEVALNCLKQT